MVCTIRARTIGAVFLNFVYIFLTLRMNHLAPIKCNNRLFSIFFFIIFLFISILCWLTGLRRTYPIVGQRPWIAKCLDFFTETGLDDRLHRFLTKHLQVFFQFFFVTHKTICHFWAGIIRHCFIHIHFFFLVCDVALFLCNFLGGRIFSIFFFVRFFSKHSHIYALDRILIHNKNRRHH